MTKSILFITGTRADYGKLKPFMEIIQKSEKFHLSIFATGMHLDKDYGYTFNQIMRDGFKDVFPYISHGYQNRMDQSLSSVIKGLSDFLIQRKIDLIVVHGDRSDALAGAIVGSLNNIRILHLEGGELSGTVDEMLRHAVSKLSHIHFVSNEDSKKRLVNMGEKPNNIHVIGSPDVDVMLSENLPTLETVLSRYEIDFDNYGISLLHPVTTELESIDSFVDEYFDSLESCDKNFVHIFPNSDHGNERIIERLKSFKSRGKSRVIPSMRFEYFLTLLKNSKLIIGNSSAGIREAPYYGVPTVNVGSRQFLRSKNPNIHNCNFSKEDLNEAINNLWGVYLPPIYEFGLGDSRQKISQIMEKIDLSKIDLQKTFYSANTQE